MITGPRGNFKGHDVEDRPGRRCVVLAYHLRAHARSRSNAQTKGVAQ